MANTDPARRPPYRRRPLNPDHNFHESLASPITPSRTYRSENNLETGHTTPLERLLRVAAWALVLLLALRFVAHLFTSAHGGWNGAIDSISNWLVTPFQGLPQPTITSGGTFDWPAVSAAIVVVVVAAVLIRLARPTQNSS